MTDVNSLLRLANGAALHKALARRKLGVSYRTVARWVGDEPDAYPAPAYVPAILEAFGLDTTTEEAPQPEWAEAMEKRLRLELRLNRAIMESVDPDEIERIRVELHAEIPVERLPAADDPPEAPHPQGGSPSIAQ